MTSIDAPVSSSRPFGQTLADQAFEPVVEEGGRLFDADRGIPIGEYGARGAGRGLRDAAGLI